MTPNTLIASLLSLVVQTQPPPVTPATYWPQWRGPTSTGAAQDASPPTEWSETKNIRWKVPIPGHGSSSPIVWGDRVFVTTAVKTDRPAKPADRDQVAAGATPARREIARSVHKPPANVYQFVVMALDRRTGKTLWRQVAREERPHEAGHPDGSLASASPVTDGEHLFASFGSRGLHCFEMDGTPVWSKDLGHMVTRRGHGEGSSPALFGDTIVVNWDHEGESFLVALDKTTGRELWRQARDEITSWATPLILEANGKPQVVVCATGFVRGYELATGEELWKCGGMTVNAIPSPVAGLGMVFALSGYRGDALRAIKYAEAKGDITNSAAVAWSHNKGLPYVPSPLLYDDTLYFIAKNRPMLSCFDAKTGRQHYGRQRLAGLREIYASPVGAGGRVYIVGRDGGALVLHHGPELKVLATNKLNDAFDASPAIVGNEMFLRGRKHLYCIAPD